MKYSLLFLLAPLTVWSRQCDCGYANQDACASALADRADAYTRVASSVQQGRIDDPSGSAVRTTGEQTGLREYPFIAAVVYKSGPAILCAGTIIDEHHVLIAAHCVHGLRADSLGVHVGSNRFNTTSGKLETVADIHNHPQWDPERLVYDIALLQLQDALTFDRYTTGPICVFGRPQSLNNRKAVAVSWDSAPGREKAVSSLLQETFKTQNVACCGAGPSGGPQFCAYATETADCNQWSDGSLLLWRNQNSKRYFALGISSYGQSCKQFPEVVTDVTQLRPWIQSVLQADGGRIGA